MVLPALHSATRAAILLGLQLQKSNLEEKMNRLEVPDASPNSIREYAKSVGFLRRMEFLEGIGKRQSPRS